MSKPKMTMRESIEALPFSTRLRTALMNYSDYPQRREFVFEDIIEQFRKNPLDFRTDFLRTPGVGPLTFEELREFIEDIGDDGDYRGRTIALGFYQAAAAQDAIAEACNSIGPNTPTYQTLRLIQRWLDAGTIHLEQVDDRRPMFQGDR